MIISQNSRMQTKFVFQQFSKWEQIRLIVCFVQTKQTLRTRELNYLENVHPPTPTTCHMSCATCCLSCVTYRMSCVKSHIFSSSFYTGQIGEAYGCRVCYQRGLPRLVYHPQDKFNPKMSWPQHVVGTACNYIWQIRQIKYRSLSTVLAIQGKFLSPVCKVI